MKPLDFTKPITTRDGRKVRILCTDGPDKKYPIIGIVDNCISVSWWTIKGHSSTYDPDVDLSNAPNKRKVEFWVNVYPSEYHTMYYDKEAANDAAGKSRIACLHFVREYEEGEGL